MSLGETHQPIKLGNEAGKVLDPGQEQTQTGPKPTSIYLDAVIWEIQVMAFDFTTHRSGEP
jgi:hypothetical protein